jgi:hypothetical protein
MTYALAILKALFSLALFAAAASISSSNFQNIVIAGLGLIFVTTDIGIASLLQKQGEGMISDLRFFILVLRATANEEIDSLYLENRIAAAEKKLEQRKITLGIQAITGIFIFLGCIYLIFEAVLV